MTTSRGLGVDRRDVLGALLGALASGAGGIAAANAPRTGTRLITDPTTTNGDELLYASSTTLDRIGRIMAPVMVNGTGPHRFVVDTGASHSTIAPRLAKLLQLDLGAGPTVILNGVTGSAEVPTVLVDRIDAGAMSLTDQVTPVLWSSIMADADGILGVAGLTRQRIEVDFRSNHIAISNARARRIEGSPLRIGARRLAGGMLVVNGRVGLRRTKIVVDTGAERTLGNRALLQALQRRRPEAPSTATVHGATSQTTLGERWRAPSIELGRLVVADVDVTFGDFHVFKVWGIDERPALLLGMDVIGVLDALVIDYRALEITVFTGSVRRRTPPLHKVS
jgi:predicted aspartyl protease